MATEDQKADFKEQLEELVQIGRNADTNLYCQDLHCSDTSYSNARDNCVADMLTAVIETTQFILPTYGGCQVDDRRPGLTIPGWKGEVKPYRDSSLNWGDIWRANGRQTTGWIHENYKAARRQYHYHYAVL